ncbi:hypothetical protein [Streptomyces sparsus]
MRRQRFGHERGDGKVAVAVLAVVVSSLALFGCSSNGEGEEVKGNKPSEGRSSGDEATNSPPSEVDTDSVIGELRGDGFVVSVHSATRDGGGFVTVQATLKNEGEKTMTSNKWGSPETALKSKSSISGATLIDRQGKKRYMVLRDTDGECLCTTNLVRIKPNEERAIYAQFPAPPNDVTEVDLLIPTLSPASIEISEG